MNGNMISQLFATVLLATCNCAIGYLPPPPREKPILPIVKVYLALERIAASIQERSLKTDVVLGVSESITFEILNRIFRDSSGSSGGTLGDPVYWTLRSFFSDFISKATQPLLPTKPLPLSTSANLTSAVDEVDNIRNDDPIAFLATSKRTSNAKVETREISSYHELSGKRRKFFASVVRFVIIPLIVHSVVHTLSSMSTHELLDEILK